MGGAQEVPIACRCCGSKDAPSSNGVERFQATGLDRCQALRLRVEKNIEASQEAQLSSRKLPSPLNNCHSVWRRLSQHAAHLKHSISE